MSCGAHYAGSRLASRTYVCGFLLVNYCCGVVLSSTFCAPASVFCAVLCTAFCVVFLVACPASLAAALVSWPASFTAEVCAVLVVVVDAVESCAIAVVLRHNKHPIREFPQSSWASYFALDFESEMPLPAVRSTTQCRKLSRSLQICKKIERSRQGWNPTPRIDACQW